MNGPGLTPGLQGSSCGPHREVIAAGWEGDRTPVTKPAPHFLLGVAGVGSMCAAPGWELPGLALPWMQESGEGKKGLESTFPGGVHGLACLSL